MGLSQLKVSSRTTASELFWLKKFTHITLEYIKYIRSLGLVCSGISCGVSWPWIDGHQPLHHYSPQQDGAGGK